MTVTGCEGEVCTSTGYFLGRRPLTTASSGVGGHRFEQNRVDLIVNLIRSGSDGRPKPRLKDGACGDAVVDHGGTLLAAAKRDAEGGEEADGGPDSSEHGSREWLGPVVWWLANDAPACCS